MCVCACCVCVCVLGPTLFSAFINDLPSVLPQNSTALFADDTSISIVSDSLPTLESSLQLSLDLANLCLERNGLKLNSSITKSMLIHSNRKSSSEIKLKIDGIEVEQVRCFKFLRVLVNDTLTWSDHINLVCTKVTRSLSLLRHLSWFIPQSRFLLYLKSYILPSFDYCDVVWSGYTKDEALQLETLLNFASRTVLRKRRDYSASAACKQLGLSTLSCRRKLHLAQTMFKCLSSQSPQYLSQLFSAPSSHYNTRSSSSSQHNLPCTKTSLGQKAFSFAGASLWRSLPANIRTHRDFKAFSNHCKDLFA